MKFRQTTYVSFQGKRFDINEVIKIIKKEYKDKPEPQIEVFNKLKRHSIMGEKIKWLKYESI